MEGDERKLQDDHPSSIETISVLVVDDDKGIRDTMVDILEAIGINAFLAESGERAIEIAKRRPFDWILMDYKMPGMDGLQASNVLKEIQPKTKIVLVTAYATEDVCAVAQQFGIFEVLYKPIDLEHLTSMIKSEI